MIGTSITSFDTSDTSTSFDSESRTLFPLIWVFYVNLSTDTVRTHLTPPVRRSSRDIDSAGTSPVMDGIEITDRILYGKWVLESVDVEVLGSGPVVTSEPEVGLEGRLRCELPRGW